MKIFCFNFRWLLLCVKLNYFQSAIAASINLRSKLELVLNQDGQVSVDLPAVGITRSWTVQEIAEHFTLPLGKMSSSFAPAKNNYSKTCLKRPLQKKTKIGFQDRLSLNADQK